MPTKEEADTMLATERDRFTAVLERIEDHVKMIAEGHLVLNAKLDVVQSDLTAMRGTLWRHDERLARVETLVSHRPPRRAKRKPRRPSDSLDRLSMPCHPPMNVHAHQRTPGRSRS